MKQAILSHADADQLYQLIEGITCTSRSINQQVAQLGGLYANILKRITKTESQFFANAYTRSVFVFDTYALPEEITKPLNTLGYLSKEIYKNQRFPINKNNYQVAVKGICKLVYFFTNAPVPEKLEDLYLQSILAQALTSSISTPKILPLLAGIVMGKDEIKEAANGKKYFRIRCKSETTGMVQVYIGNELIYLYNIIWKYARINLTNLELRSKEEQAEKTKTEIETEKNRQNNTATATQATATANQSLQTYFTTAKSLAILDPDFLVNASAIASCQLKGGSNPLWYLVNKFFTLLPNYYLMRGNMVNDYLDKFLLDQKTSPSEIFDQILLRSPLHSLLFDPQKKAELVQEVKQHTHTLHNGFLQDYKNHRLSIEPTFLSSRYGLRGRLDMLVEFDDDPKRKEVVELKTSKDPMQYGTFIHKRDAAQAICYDLLIGSTANDLKVSSAILYSSAAPNADPLRNAENTIKAQREVLRTRNILAYYEYKLTLEPARILGFIKPANFHKYGLFHNQVNDINRFRSALYNASELERNYFFEFVRFIAREQRSAKIGSHIERGNEGFSALWNLHQYEKEKNYSILAYLHFEESVMVGDKKLLKFVKTPDKTIPISTFRSGDFILMYPHNPNGELSPMQHQIIKGTIKENHADYVLISPMNAFIKDEHFDAYSYWAAEIELFELAFNAMYESLFSFLELPQAKKDLLLGLSQPRFSEKPSNLITPPDIELKDKQQEVLEQALSAQDYFLLQGPPGTGKTKVMLRTLVMNLLQNPDEKILLLAYTNRAVDEMCEALKMIDPKPEFIRLGYGDTTVHKDVVLSRYAKGKPIMQLRQDIANCRIFVSTVLTYLRSPALAEKIRFNTAIVDEASQLLEPQIIGALGKVQRFILIGDEKQLPAVVTQQDSGVAPLEEVIHQIGIKNLCVSMFERLLKTCQDNAWDNAYNMLQHQGRMHEAIGAFPAQQYYGGKLQAFLPQQSLPISERVYPNEKIQALLGKKRIVFINTQSENSRNINYQEAGIAAWLIQSIQTIWGDEFNRNTIGVITPYRAQIAEIKSRLPQPLQDQVSVDTVERYQGSQRDVIVISLAVNHPKQLDFLHVLSEDGKVDKKLNVALTRARQHLVIIGCGEVLKHSPIYKELLAYYEEFGVVMNGEEMDL